MSNPTQKGLHTRGGCKNLFYYSQLYHHFKICDLCRFAIHQIRETLQKIAEINSRAHLQWAKHQQQPPQRLPCPRLLAQDVHTQQRTPWFSPAQDVPLQGFQPQWLSDPADAKATTWTPTPKSNKWAPRLSSWPSTCTAVNVSRVPWFSLSRSRASVNIVATHSVWIVMSGWTLNGLHTGLSSVE